MASQELGELMRSKRGAIICVDKVRKSILVYEFIQALGQGVERLGCDFIEKGVLAEKDCR